MLFLTLSVLFAICFANQIVDEQALGAKLYAERQQAQNRMSGDMDEEASRVNAQGMTLFLVPFPKASIF